MRGGWLITNLTSVALSASVSTRKGLRPPSFQDLRQLTLGRTPDSSRIKQPEAADVARVSRSESQRDLRSRRRLRESDLVRYEDSNVWRQKSSDLRKPRQRRPRVNATIRRAASIQSATLATSEIRTRPRPGLPSPESRPR